jgi:hypothetical protein
MRPVGLYLHSPAASKTLLTPPQFAVHELLIHGQTRRQSRKEPDQGLAVGLAGGEIAKHAERAL